MLFLLYIRMFDLYKWVEKIVKIILKIVKIINEIIVFIVDVVLVVKCIGIMYDEISGIKEVIFIMIFCGLFVLNVMLII